MNAVARHRSEIPYNHEVFRWARERLEYALELAAKKTNVSVDRVEEWESGDKSPTVIQARKLAALYDRPFLEFFSKTIPNVPETELVPDFRFQRGVNSAENIALREIQTWAEEQRLNALDLLQLIGEEAPTFPTEFYSGVHDDVEEVAKKVRAGLNFDIGVQRSMKSKDRGTLPGILRQMIESCGVLVLKQSGIRKLRARGICLYAEPLPVIIFGSEAPSGQAFTLVHEFAHILLKTSAISGAPRFGNGSPSKKVEGWCNRFAAAFLMPIENIAADMGAIDEPMSAISDDRLRLLANRYAVSQHAMLIRLVNLRYVHPLYYWRVKRPGFIAQEEEYKGGGRSAYYGTRYRNSRGDLYTGLVLEAWNGGRITNHNAAEFMGIKNLTHLNDIRDNFKA